MLRKLYLLYGLLIVWTYAAVRPRLGPGPGTAVISAFAVFLATGLIYVSFGDWFLSWNMVIRVSVMALVSMLAGGLAGAYLYQEEDGSDGTGH